jgi:NAD(P)-dependent dehydrogenase (short-subunit alcohol dehydrogenase family)
LTKTVLITGAGKGIGLALAELFLANGYAVIGTNRSGQMDGLQHEKLTMLPLDLTSTESIAAFEKEIQRQNLTVDMLINNAAIGPDLDADLPEADSFTQTFAANVTGTVFFTELLIKYISKNGKLVNISSKMGSIGQCVQSDAPAYRMSKAALNMYTKVLANRLIGNIVVAAVHPGWVRTTLTAGNVHARLSPEQSAAGIYAFVTSDFATATFWNIETQTVIDW